MILKRVPSTRECVNERIAKHTLPSFIDPSRLSANLTNVCSIASCDLAWWKLHSLVENERDAAEKGKVFTQRRVVSWPSTMTALMFRSNQLCGVTMRIMVDEERIRTHWVAYIKKVAHLRLILQGTAGRLQLATTWTSWDSNIWSWPWCPSTSTMVHQHMPSQHHDAKDWILL